MSPRRPWPTARVALALIAGLLGADWATGQTPDAGPAPAPSQAPAPVPTPTPRPVPKGTVVNDQLIFASPTCSITLAPGWRAVVASDASRLDFHQHVLGAMNERARAEFERTFGASLARTPAMLTNGSGALVTVAITENRSVRYRPGYEMTARDREVFWREFSRRLLATAPEHDKPVLVMRSVNVKEYPDSPALVVVYTREDILGANIWTQVTFFSEDTSITLAHLATIANPTNGLVDFDKMARSFRFGT
jgi:hypothetical protein